MISIPSTSESDGVVYYDVLIKLPLRTITVKRRYSEFQTFVKEMSQRIGISQTDFPYSLPPKRSWFQNNEAVVDERKAGLCAFLNSLVNDSSLRNDKLVHEFLRLPKNFKLTSSTNKDVPLDSILNVHIKSITTDNWFEVLRSVRAFVEDMKEKYSEDSSVKSRISIKNQLNRVIKVNISKLSQSLEIHKASLSSEEFKERESLLSAVTIDYNQLDSLTNSSKDLDSSNVGEDDNSDWFSRRKISDDVKETESTLPLDNQELLQQQIQTHKEQDQEVEQLRTLIARQRKIAEVINNEVEQQNEMLDILNDDVENSGANLQGARNRAKKVL